MPINTPSPLATQIPNDPLGPRGYSSRQPVVCSTYLAVQILGEWYRAPRNVSSYIVGATSGGDMLLAVSDTGTLGLGR